MDDRPVEGQHVLVVEDEVLIAMEVEDMLREFGAADVTLCGTYEVASRAVETTDASVGIFDVNLHGRVATPLIERFMARGGRAVVASGQTNDPHIKALDVVVLAKPYDEESMARALRQVAKGKAPGRKVPGGMVPG